MVLAGGHVPDVVALQSPLRTGRGDVAEVPLGLMCQPDAWSLPHLTSRHQAFYAPRHKPLGAARCGQRMRPCTQVTPAAHIRTRRSLPINKTEPLAGAVRSPPSSTAVVCRPALQLRQLSGHP